MALIILGIPRTFGQSNNAEAALYNIGLGSVFSGIGAVINKEPEEKFGRVLIKGMVQGAIGGYVVYESKSLLRKVVQEEQLEYNWGAKLINSAGISIIENAALNRNFWEQWNLHIGFNRVEFHTSGEFKFRYRIMPAAFLMTTYAAIGNKFEVERSLRAGEFIFSTSKLRVNEDGLVAAGIAIGPAIVMAEPFLENYHTYTHELVHIYQYYDFNFINTYIRKPVEKLKLNYKGLNTLESIFYLDIQSPFGAGLYLLQSYENSFIEKEARYYSR